MHTVERFNDPCWRLLNKVRPPPISPRNASSAICPSCLSTTASSWSMSSRRLLSFEVARRYSASRTDDACQTCLQNAASSGEWSPGDPPGPRPRHRPSWLHHPSVSHLDRPFSSSRSVLSALRLPCQPVSRPRWLYRKGRQWSVRMQQLAISPTVLAPAIRCSRDLAARH